MNFKCTARKSPQDSRDYIADKMLVPITTFPTDLDLRPYLQPIRNQGSQEPVRHKQVRVVKNGKREKILVYKNIFHRSLFIIIELIKQQKVCMGEMS